MVDFVVKDKDGRSIEDWRAWGRPKREMQWRAGRSAMELARAWFTSSDARCPPEILNLLETHPRTAGIKLTEGYPEYVTSLPERGEGCNHDLQCAERHVEERVYLHHEYAAAASGNLLRLRMRRLHGLVATS